MATYYDSVDTSEGIAYVLTKTRYLGIVPLPRTSVMPHSGRELGSLGTAIEVAHERPCDTTDILVALSSWFGMTGVSGIREIANSARMSDSRR